jgi:hypothetical protein
VSELVEIDLSHGDCRSLVEGQRPSKGREEVRNTNVMGWKRMRDLAGCAGFDLMHESRPTIHTNTYGESDFP